MSRKRGNTAGFWFFRMSVKIFGLCGAYALLVFVAAYYWIFDRRARRTACAYLKRRFRGHARWKGCFDIYRLFYSLGISLIDRYVMVLHPALFNLSIRNYDLARPLVLDKERGFVLLTSHVGNWQAVMLALTRMNRRVTLLMRPEDNEAVRRSLRIHESNTMMNFVSPDLPMSGVLELTQRMQCADIVAIMGDRTYDAEAVEVSFAGDRAYFPQGAFHLALVWKCPVVVLFSAKTGRNSYDVEIAGVIDPQQAAGDTKRDRIRNMVQAYADWLSKYTERYPYQLYLFQDVWTPPAKAGLKDR